MSEQTERPEFHPDPAEDPDGDDEDVSVTYNPDDPESGDEFQRT